MDQEMSFYDFYNELPLSEIVEYVLKTEVIENISEGDKILEKALTKAVLGNIYITDKNSIDTIKELAWRIYNPYTNIYLKHIKDVSEDPMLSAAHLDDMVRTSLTTVGILWCLLTNHKDDLGLFLADDPIEFITDASGDYLGCIIYAANGIIYNTRTRRIMAGESIMAGIPDETAEILAWRLGAQEYNSSELMEARTDIIQKDVDLIWEAEKEYRHEQHV